MNAAEKNSAVARAFDRRGVLAAFILAANE